MHLSNLYDLEPTRQLPIEQKRVLLYQRVGSPKKNSNWAPSMVINNSFRCLQNRPPPNPQNLSRFKSQIQNLNCVKRPNSLLIRGSDQNEIDCNLESSTINNLQNMRSSVQNVKVMNPQIRNSEIKLRGTGIMDELEGLIRTSKPPSFLQEDRKSVV